METTLKQGGGGFAEALHPGTPRIQPAEASYMPFAATSHTKILLTRLLSGKS